MAQQQYMVQCFYFDTSVFGGVFDPEFEEASIQLFEKVTLGQIHCMDSDLTEGELFNAPERVATFSNNCQEHLWFQYV